MKISHYEQISDKELVNLHLSGDKHAFHYIFTRYYPRLWAVALRNTSSAHDAEDCLQEAMLKAHHVIDKFQWKSNLSSWLHRIVVNTCIDRTRANKKAPLTIGDYQPLESYICCHEDKDTILTVREALESLQPEHREIIQLIDIEGFSLKEVSDMLHIPIGTVKSRSARARLRLTEALHPHN